MTNKVVVKGESVYECDQCTRRVRVPSNKQGIDILQRCIITYGCRGSLRRLTQAKDINSTPAFPPEVEGVQDWFQRQVFYEHVQPVDAQVWTVVHNLANRPIFHAFTYTLDNGKKVLVANENFSVRTIDMNTSELTFSSSVSGLVQAITLSSQNTTNPEVTNASNASDLFQVTTDSGELTIATKSTLVDGWNDPLVSITVVYGTTSPVTITYANVDDTPSIDSPWVGGQRVVANGKNFLLRSFNIVNTLPAPSHFANGEIPNGTPFRISKINNTSVGPGDVLVALGKSPFAAVDRITDKYVDAGRTDVTFTYDTGKAYVTSQQVKPIYPFITVV